MPRLDKRTNVKEKRRFLRNILKTVTDYDTFKS